MRFPHRKKVKPQDPKIAESLRQAKEAKKASEVRLAETKGRWAEINDTVGSLAQARHENHFTEKLISAFGGRQ